MLARARAEINGALNSILVLYSDRCYLLSKAQQIDRISLIPNVGRVQSRCQSWPQANVNHDRIELFFEIAEDQVLVMLPVLVVVLLLFHGRFELFFLSLGIGNSRLLPLSQSS